MVRAFALSCLLAAALRTPGTRHDAESWQVLHTVTGHDQWLTAVWARQGGAWFAGGKNVLLSGRDSSVKETATPGAVVYRFGEDSTGRVIAVGLRAMVWEQDGDGLRLVYQSNSPPSRGRAAYNDLLYGIGYLDPTSAGTLIAYGPNDLIAYRSPSGAWETKRDRSLASWAQTGPPKGDIPSGCQRLYWHWLSRDQAFELCRDGRSYLVSKGVPEEAGRLPSSCKQSVYAIAQDHDDLFVACGPTQKIWLRQAGHPKWDAVPGAPAGVRALAAKDGCLMVATEHQVWRWCRATGN